MKRFLALAAALLMLCSFAACNRNDGVVVEPSITMDKEESLQQSVIGSLGITTDGVQIVAFKVVDGSHLENIVVEYDTSTGAKKSESVHCFYYNDSYYRKAKNELGENAAATCDDEAWYIKKASMNVANTGEFESDLHMVLNAGYTKK